MSLLSNDVTLPGGGDYNQEEAPVEMKTRPGQEEQEMKTNDGITLAGRPIAVDDDCNPPHPESPIGKTTTANYQEEEVIAPRSGMMAPKDSMR